MADRSRPKTKAKTFLIRKTPKAWSLMATRASRWSAVARGSSIEAEYQHPGWAKLK
jgi:hypothetical protein